MTFRDFTCLHCVARVVYGSNTHAIGSCGYNPPDKDAYKIPAVYSNTKCWLGFITTKAEQSINALEAQEHCR